MTTRTKPRHRKATRPVTPLTAVAPGARRGFAVAASSGLALTMLASAASAAGGSTELDSSAGALGATGVGAIATPVREAVTTNDAVVAPADAQWVSEATVEAAVEAAVAEEPAPEETTDQGQGEQTTAASTTETVAYQAPAAAPSASSIAALAMQYVGAPYVSGAGGPSAFDCSGLVSYVYAQFGYDLPHSSGGIYAAGTVISASEAQPGDVLYWPGHVGIYTGGGMMVDAGTEATGVHYHSVYDGAIYLRF